MDNRKIKYNNVGSEEFDRLKESTHIFFENYDFEPDDIDFSVTFRSGSPIEICPINSSIRKMYKSKNLIQKVEPCKGILLGLIDLQENHSFVRLLIDEISYDLYFKPKEDGLR
jgi:hypothetical protein